MQDNIEYVDLHHLMRNCGLTQTPAEAQGVAAGLHAVGGREADAVWAAEFLADLAGNDAGECRVRLNELRDRSAASLAEGDFSFALLLPDETLRDRAAALRDWCQGFMYAFGTGGARCMARLSREGGEAINDFGEITRLDVDDVPADDTGNASLTELEEYIRMAAMVVVEDMRQEQTDESD